MLSFGFSTMQLNGKVCPFSASSPMCVYIDFFSRLVFRVFVICNQSLFLLLYFFSIWILSSSSCRSTFAVYFKKSFDHLCWMVYMYGVELNWIELCCVGPYGRSQKNVSNVRWSTAIQYGRMDTHRHICTEIRSRSILMVRWPRENVTNVLNLRIN